MDFLVVVWSMIVGGLAGEVEGVVDVVADVLLVDVDYVPTSLRNLGMKALEQRR